MRTRVLLGIPFLLSLSFPALAAVMVLPVEATNLEPGEADAIGHMVASSYQLAVKDNVIAPGEVQKALDETGSYPAAAQKLGATEYLYVSAVRLNQRIVITGARYSRDGKLLFSERVSATTLDDAEPGSERLARALVAHQTPLEARTIDNVMMTEKTPPNRVGSQKVAGFKGGFTYPVGWHDSLAPMMSASFDLRLESEKHFIEFGLGFTVPAGDYDYMYGGLFGDIGGNLYLLHESTAPYVGIGVMPRLMGENIANLAIYGQGGVMFFREGATRLYVEARVAQNLLPVTFGGGIPTDTYDSATGTYVPGPAVEKKSFYPTEFSLNIGMGF
ncbi:MAG TPA: hypothetical protein VF103_11005 [Polyangiaceae bacterium]